MIYIEEVSRDWERDGEWRIAPDGVDWIAEGSRIFVESGARIEARARIGSDAHIESGAHIGSGAHIESWAHIGSGARIGPHSTDVIDLGFTDGYRKCIAQVKGVAYIGAGCRWFTLAEALKHWGAKDDRILTMCLMQSAVAIAGYKGWSHE